MSKREWILIGVACVAAVVGYAAASLIPRHEVASHHNDISAGTFVAIFLPLFAAVMAVRQKTKKSNSNG